MIKKHWLELIVFGVILAILIICVAPSATWVNTDSDGIHDTYAAANLYLSHKTSMPLYLLVGHLFTLVPFGTQFWSLALFSALATFGSCIFIYLTIKYHLYHNKRVRLFALLGVLIYGGSALVISQSTIVETYALVTMFSIGAYYFYIRKNWYACALMLGLGLTVHVLIGLFVIVLFIASPELRRPKPILIILACLLFYLYIPLSTLIHPEQPNMWGNRTYVDMFKDLIATTQMLFGSLAIYDLPKRILDTIGIVGVSMGLAIVPVIVFIRKNQKMRNVLFWLFVLPIIMFVIGLPPQTYVYCMPSIAIGAVIACIALSKMNMAWFYAVTIVAVGLLAFNANYFDIGRTLDPELSATQYYNEELAKVPDGQILMPYYGWEWAAIYSYNKNEDRNIIPVCSDTLLSDVYQNMLSEQGIKYEVVDNPDRMAKQVSIAQSIVMLNDNVWGTVISDPETYGTKVVPATIEIYDKVAPEPPGQIHWKPSNPYLFITGALEVSEWGFITLSNWNVLLFMSLGAIGLTLNYLIFILPAKKKKGKNEDTIHEKA